MLHEVLAYNLARKEEKNNLKAFAKKSEYLDRSGYSFFLGGSRILMKMKCKH